MLLQVTARIDDGAGAGPQRPGGQLKAALGTKWAHCVNVRLVLERYHQNRFIKVGCRAGRMCVCGVGMGGGGAACWCLNVQACVVAVVLGRCRFACCLHDAGVVRMMGFRVDR